MNVVHLIPYNGIGGVESAARSLLSGFYVGIYFHKYYLAHRTCESELQIGDEVGVFGSENDPRNFFHALLWLHQRRPQLIIASLWRTYAVVLLYKLIHPRCRFVCFLHSGRAVHAVDWLLAFLAMALASEIWADSQSTLKSRIPIKWHHRARVISFVLRYVQAGTQERPSPRFIFWGRLAPEKGLDRAIHIIAALNREIPDVRFQVIGPDCGELPRLLSLVDKLCLGSVVSFLGPKGPQEIQVLASQASFYLQTSVFEGMAISVVEAMQFGLVPVVTPVGEAASYCSDNFNALFVDSNDPMAASKRIHQLLLNPSLYSVLRLRAIDSWSKASNYSDSVITRCRAFMP